MSEDRLVTDPDLVGAIDQDQLAEVTDQEDLVEAGDLQEGMVEKDEGVLVDLQAEGQAVLIEVEEVAAVARAEADLEDSFNLYAVVQLLWPSG